MQRLCARTARRGKTIKRHEKSLWQDRKIVKEKIRE